MSAPTNRIQALEQRVERQAVMLRKFERERQAVYELCGRRGPLPEIVGEAIARADARASSLRTLRAARAASSGEKFKDESPI